MCRSELWQVARRCSTKFLPSPHPYIGHNSNKHLYNLQCGKLLSAIGCQASILMRRPDQMPAHLRRSSFKGALPKDAWHPLDNDLFVGVHFARVTTYQWHICEKYKNRKQIINQVWCNDTQKIPLSTTRTYECERPSRSLSGRWIRMMWMQVVHLLQKKKCIA